ncbi:MAG: SRPBCC domain-containing protein [Bauldia sp.]
MDAKVSPTIDPALREVVITRTFDAPRDLVWQAWTDPKHVAQWWGPHGFDAPHPSVDLRPGGAMNFDMRAPDGSILPGPVIIRELKAPEKLVISSRAFVDEAGNAQFEVLVTVTLAEEDGKTTLTVRATVTKATAAALPALKGMRQGWTETLEKLGEHLAITRWTATAGKGAKGATSFVVPGDEPVVVIRRTFEAPRALVWQAITDPDMRAKWWGPTDYQVNVRELDARVGGKWRIDHVGEDGKTYEFWGEFTEVRAPQRLVNTFRFESYPPAIETITLAERDGRTTLTNVTRVDTFEHRNGWVETGMERGARESMDRLADLLKTM